MRQDDKKRGGVLRAVSFSSQIGVLMAACVFVGVFLGQWLDGVFGTSPGLLLLCSLLGVGAAFRSLYLVIKKI
jgi:ATP synthase protein I